jgi:uncharacterized membrane protein YdjX (TVP38/TMEM64 family)
MVRTAVRLFMAIFLLGAGVLALRVLKKSGVIEQALAWLSSLGAWAPLMFIALYILAVIFFIPASVLTLGGGFLFGMKMGSLYVFTSALLSSTICFLISRHFARDWIERKFRGNPKFIALDEATAREGWKIVVMVRLGLGFPLTPTSYGFGLTRVPLWQYVLCSFVMIPSTMMYVYFGTLLGDVAGLGKGGSVVPLWVKGLIILTAILVTIYVTRFTQRALRQHAPGADGRPLQK